MDEPLPRVSAGEAAARLGVKLETLYAYVSRGMLTRERTRAGSTFDPFEVERFALSRARRTGPGEAAPPRQAGAPLMVLDTDIAFIDGGELFFRGRPAAELATAAPFDAVAAWLWGEPLDPDRRLSVDDAAVGAARPAVLALPAAASLLDRAAVAVHGLAIADPLRHDGSPSNLPRVGERIAAGLPRALATTDRPRGSGSVVEALWPVLTAEPATPQRLAVLDAALVLSIDHDLAISTMSARVAASARASGYAVTTAALGAFDSPMHGNTGQAAAELIELVRSGVTPERAIASHLRTRAGGVPGFGQALYPGMDARARILLPLVAELPGASPIIAAVEALADALGPSGPRPNLDLALAALALTGRMAPDAPGLMFATGRLAGWISHAVSEYAAQPMRLRPRGRYIGPLP